MQVRIELTAEENEILEKASELTGRSKRMFAKIGAVQSAKAQLAWSAKKFEPGVISWLKRVYKGMRQRCYNPNSPHYKRYGGVGIKMCDKWRNSFDAFVTDVGPPPPERGDGKSIFYSLDRYPDPNGNYEPGNVRWATDFEQGNNKRKQGFWKNPS